MLVYLTITCGAHVKKFDYDGDNSAVVLPVDGDLVKDFFDGEYSWHRVILRRFTFNTGSISVDIFTEQV